MTHPNPSTAMATVVLDEFARHDIRHVVLAPGSRSASLALEAARSSRLQVHVELDERSAGFLAVGIGRSTGIPALVVTTSGTAVANLLPAVVEADLGAVPVVLLTADRPPELRDRGANQTIEQQGIFGSSVRWAFDPGPAEDRPSSNRLWRSMTSRAVAASCGALGSPGPVHLNLPFREPLVPSSDDGRATAPLFESPTEGRPDRAPWTRTDAPAVPDVSVGSPSGRALVLAGDVPVPGGLDLDALAFGAEPHSGSRRPGSLGSLHYLASHPEGGRLRPDSVVHLGRTGLSRPLETWLGDVPATVFDPLGRWPDPRAEALSIIRGSLELPAAEPGWLATLRRIDESVASAIRHHLDGLDAPSEPRTARDAARAVPEGGRLVVASSMPIRDLAVFMEPTAARVHANRGASGIDGFVSTALGVAIGSEAPTVALSGDLSMLHDSNGLLLDERPDCVFVVVDNDGGGIFSFLPQADHARDFERVFGTPHGRDLSRLADFHGVPHLPISDPASLVDEIRGALSAGGVSIVSVRTDRDENVSLHQELTATAHRAIDGVL